MSLDYRVPVRLGRTNLRQLDDTEFRDTVGEYLNHILDVLQGLGVTEETKEEVSVKVREVAAMEGKWDGLFPNPRRVVKWATASCAVDTTTDVISGVADKYLGIVYIHANNTDADEGKTVHFLHEGDGTEYFKSWFALGGATFLINLMGSCLIGDAINKKFQCVVSDDGAGPINVTVGYVELDTDFVEYDEERDRWEQGNPEEPY